MVNTYIYMFFEYSVGIYDIIGCQKSLAVFILNFQLFIKLVTIMRFKSNMGRFVRWRVPVWASRCRKWPIFHRQSPSASKTGRFCCFELLFESNLLQMVYNGLTTHDSALGRCYGCYYAGLFRSIQRFCRNFRRQAFRTVAHLRSPLHQNENVETIVVRWKWKL